jgi:predicted RND superfamily exporter protein
VLFAAFAVVAAFGVQIPNIVVDTTTEGFLREDDPILAVYDDFRARFGRDDSIILGVEAADVLAPEFLATLRKLHDDLEAEVPFVDEITSLLNARWTRGEDDQLIVEDLVAQWPQSAADYAELRAKVFSNPVYLNFLVSKDGTLTTVQIDLETYVEEGRDEEGKPILRYLHGDEIREVVEAIMRLMSRYESPGFRLHAAGTPWLSDRMAYHTVTDFGRLTAVSIAVMAVILFVVFGTVRGVLLPLVVVVVSVVCTLGLLVLLDMPYQQPTQLVPISLLAIGLGDSVHVLSIYYQRRSRDVGKHAAIAGALAHTGIAIVMTSVTTAAAMMSFLSAELTPIANIGVLVPAGVLFALAFTLTILPALLSILPEHRISRTRRRMALLERVIVSAGTAAARHPMPVVAVSVVVIVASIVGMTELRFSHNPLKWFPEGDPMRVATETLNRKLGGVMNAEVLFETGREGGVKDPELLRALEDITSINDAYSMTVRDARARGLELRIAKTVSVVDLLKEINKALNENRQEHYVLPETKELVAQELLLFEMSGSDDLEKLTDYRYQTARMILRTPWTDATLYGDFLDRLLEQHQARVGEAAEVVSTGMLPLLFRTLTAVIHSMGRSYVLAFLAVTPLMMLLLGSLRLGLLAMIPNLLPIIAVLGIMGAVGLPLDLFSLLTGSIVLGLAVDDTIHFTSGFGRDLAETGDAVGAVHRTLQTTGQAMFFTTLILCCGFAAFAFAYMRNGVVFGSVTAIALGIALLADVVLAPALFVLASKKPADTSSAPGDSIERLAATS